MSAAALIELRRLGPAIERAEHGTRTCYVGQKCRCDRCRAANRDWYRQRMDRRAELVAEVDIRPTGPAGSKLIGGLGGRTGKTCPGANGAACVKGGSWLREGKEVCASCVERVTVWNGLVDAARAREHLRTLSAAGVGYKSVHAASDVAASVLAAVRDGSRAKIRADTERAILAVDASAIADHASVPAGPTMALIDKMRGRGFARAHISRLLGYRTKALQLGVLADRVTAKNAAAVERLWRRIESGEVEIPGPFVDAAEPYLLLQQLAAAGLSEKWLRERLGFTVTLKRPPLRMRPELASRVFSLVDEMRRAHQEGEGRPEGWEAAPSGITAAFGFEGGWGWDRRTSKRAEEREGLQLRSLANGTGASPCPKTPSPPASARSARAAAGK